MAKAGEDRTGSRRELDSPAIATHAAGEPDLAGRLRRKVDHRRARRRQTAVEVRRGEDDALRARVLVVPTEDQPERDACPRNDRVRVVAAINDDVDDLAAFEIDLSVSGMHEHGYVCPPPAKSRFAIRRVAATRIRIRTRSGMEEVQRRDLSRR